MAILSIRLAVVAALLAGVPSLYAQAVKTEVVKTATGFELLRDGKPFFIKGAGGDASCQVLADSGGNSLRTWGSDHLEETLKKVHDNHLTITIGEWLGHVDNGFSYTNAQQVEGQFAHAKMTVLKYKDEPALLVWAFGNEMETGGGDTPEMWQAVEAMAKMAHELDPNHPTMTVIAELGKDNVAQINKYCPDIDIIGVNSYGGGPSVGERYKAAGGNKPYVITEFGPAGTWEIQMTKFGAAPELSSTEKAAAYRATYEKSVLGEPGLCLGSYCFAWGSKIEATATWYGMFLADGTKLAAVDTMEELWTGKAPARPCPAIKSFKLEGSDELNAGDTAKASIEVANADGSAPTLKWVLYGEQATYDVGGIGADPTPTYPDAIQENGKAEVTVKMPGYGGKYRLFCFAYDGKNGAAMANVPLHVSGAEAPFKAAAAPLPLVVYADDQKGTPFVPSGYMGNTAAVKMTPDSATNPHSGKTCLQVDYIDGDKWAGVVWQSPANDWGTLPGGFDLTGAKKLTFWARGEKGGEKVKFGVGIIGSDKKYHDTAKASAEETLTADWKQYEIDLTGKDLSCIKSGFFWTVGGQGDSLRFYLDDIQFE